MLVKGNFILLLLVFSFLGVYAQDNPNAKQQKFKVTFKDSVIVTGDKFIIQTSEILTIDKNVLKPLVDYNIDYRNGIIKLSSSLFSDYKLDTMRIYDLITEYDLFPYNIKEEYSNFDIKIEKDTLTGDTLQIAVRSKDIIENLFEGTDLEKSGSIFRGFTLGTNRDISINSGFNLQLRGKLSSDIDITAALSDEKTPIQPEGNSQKLQELDKVFIEIRSKNLGAVIGDIDVNLRNSEFANFKRKIQGAKGFGEFGNNNFLLTGAVSRGKFNTNTFNGIDGVQGPYRLTGIDNEINIIVLSGTEKVYLDGIEMTRGEQADYTIDYNLGQITFTNKRLIKNVSRINVDFEYSDRKYSRTLIAANSTFELLNKNLNLSLSYINESDNENKTIDFNLSDSDKVILQNAGNDRLKAVKSGAVYVGKDSLNRPLGSYVKVDTILSTGNYTLYRFAPNDTAALYTVTFSYVGQGNGDYVSRSSFEYQFVGISQGSYAPVIFIPVPSAYQLASINANYSFDKNKNFLISLEGAYSYLDKNKFSSIDNNTGGFAFKGELSFKKNDFTFLGINFANFLLNYKERVINKTFNSIDRLNPVEFYRNFDLNDSASATEVYRDGNLVVSPGKLIRLQGSFAQLQRGDFFNSARITGFLDFNSLPSEKKKNLPRFRYGIENINSSNSVFGRDGNWLKQYAFAGWKKNFGGDLSKYLEISLSYNGEKRKNSFKTLSGDSLSGESFIFNEITQNFVLNNILNLNFYTELGYRKDESASRGSFFDLSSTLTQKYGIAYSGIDWFYGMFDMAIRDKSYSDEAKNLGNQDNKTVLVNSRLRFTPLRNAVTSDFMYSISSERTSKIQKLFVLVPIGQGNYIYLGDLNLNGIQDENEFQQVNFDGNYIKLNLPTDQFFPTVDLRTSARVQLKPSKYLYLGSSGILNDIYNNFSSDTYIRIDEKSKDPNTDNLYFLNFSSFLNDSNTILGTQIFQQDINLFENNPFYSFRFRFLQQKGLSQYSSGNERYLNIQRSIRVRLGFTSDLNLQVEFKNAIDRNLAPSNSVRNRSIKLNNLSTDLAYRPVPQIESGIQFNYTNATDSYPDVPNNASINQLIGRFIYSFTSVGRIRAEIERDEVILSRNVNNFPYELTSGRPQGKSYYWRLIFDYSITRNIKANINYDGRVEGAKQVIHTGRAQVTAFF